jgi:hypothetical protein
MKRKPISQREAHRLSQRVTAQVARIGQLENQVRWLRRADPSDGTEIYELKEAGGSLAWSLQTAQRLGHIVIARQRGDSVSFRALPLPSEPVK